MTDACRKILAGKSPFTILEDRAKALTQQVRIRSRARRCHMDYELLIATCGTPSRPIHRQMGIPGVIELMRAFNRLQFDTDQADHYDPTVDHIAAEWEWRRKAGFSD